MSFFDTNPAGRLLNRFSKDTEAADVQLRETLTWASTGASESLRMHSARVLATAHRCWAEVFREDLHRQGSQCLVDSSLGGQDPQCVNVNDCKGQL